MPKKDQSGENNSFYGKEHQEKAKRKMGGAVKDYNGDKNPFWGKTHTKETIDKIKKTLEGRFSGDKNPFYGKSHTDEVIDKIKDGNKKYREENNDIIMERQLKRLGFTEEKLRSYFLEYKNSAINADDLQKKVGVDKRVIFKYIELFGIATADEIAKIKDSKKMRKSKSSPELKIYNFLIEKYGKENIIWSHKINRFFYDLFVFDFLLIEYDGYYWHTCYKTNDVRKTNLAKELGIKLIRIVEPESRKTDFEKEFEKISEAIDEIQASRNNFERDI